MKNTLSDKGKKNVFAKNRISPVVSNFHQSIVGAVIWLYIFVLAFQTFRNFTKALKAVARLWRFTRKYRGTSRLKLARVDKRYYWDLNNPSFPSLAFKNNMKDELQRINKNLLVKGKLTTMILSVTNNCVLACEHCSEWNCRNEKESLSKKDLALIVKKFQEYGVAQIQISGGEPLLRFDDLVELIKSAKQGTDFWLLSSGVGLTKEKAVRLKQAGLTGVVLSLDHFDPDKHNSFRGNRRSFAWVEKAVQNVSSAHLVLALSLCATKHFVSSENLLKYAKLAREFGASFIRIVEAQAQGRYEGKDVALSEAQQHILDQFFLKMSLDNKYRSMPILEYHGYYQRRIGCFSAGNRWLFVDGNGNMHACPFCRNKEHRNVISGSLGEMIEALKLEGCPKTRNASF